MKRLQPQTIHATLQTEINEFLDKVTHTDSYDKDVFASLMGRAIELQGKGRDVVAGCLLRASLFSGTGQFADVEKMVRNVENNHGFAEARAARFSHLINHGYATDAMKLADLFFANRADYNFADVALCVMAAGGFNKVAEKLEESQRSQEVLKMTSTVLSLSTKSAEVLALLEVSDVQIAAMLDLAGEILRANRLYWQGSMPDVRILLPEHGGPALMFEYRVFVSPQESARMTWELTESRVCQNLDIPGIHIGFVGTELPVRLAA